MNILLIDPRLAGASGDMFLASVIDLVHGEKQLKELVEILNEYFGGGISVSCRDVEKQHIRAVQLDIALANDITEKYVSELIVLLNGLLDYIPLSNKAKGKIKDSFYYLFNSGSNLTVTTQEKIHLLEIASIDTFLYIVGTFYLLDKNDLLEMNVYGLPANLGSGMESIHSNTNVRTSIPVPAVEEILRVSYYPVFSDGEKGELLTPTGAAILSSLVDKTVDNIPPIRINQIGRGAGAADLSDRANILTIILGEIPEKENKHYLTMLETHLDDVSGEIMGGIITELMDNGALDVSYYPLIMKKNRPGWNLRIICEEEQAPKLAYYVMMELGTLGVRETRYIRYELDRRVVTRKIELQGKFFECRYKERIIDGKVIGAKPEYEDMKRISIETGIPLIELEKELIRKYSDVGDNDE